MTTLLLIIGLILILSGFFSGSEAALVSITQPEVEELVDKNVFGAKRLAGVKNKINRAVIAIVIMNNAINIVGSIAVGRTVLLLYGDAMLGIATTALTFAVIFFSEIIPKSLGMHYANKIAIPIAWIISGVIIVLYPVIFILECITNAMHRGERKVGTEQQIRSLVSLGRKSGHIESDEGQLIHRAFILNDKSAEDVMTPLKDMISIERGWTAIEALEKVKTTPHSRFPVFGDSIHDHQGTVMAKDILEALSGGDGDLQIDTLMREGWTVDTHTKLDELLVLFRDRHSHLAVVQEDGKTVGLVTLEDVLEELVGEIEDETDIE